MDIILLCAKKLCVFRLNANHHQGIVELLDAQGAVLQTTSFAGGKAVFDMKACPQGVYFVRIQGAPHPFTRKIIKM